MGNLALVEQQYGDYAEIDNLGVDQWHAAVRQQAGLGFDFDQELALGERALNAGRVDEAFMHLDVAEEMLTPGGDWEQRERWAHKLAEIYQAVGRNDEVVAVFHTVLHMAEEAVGGNHPLPRGLKSKLAELAWAHETGNAQRFDALLESIQDNDLPDQMDQQRNIQSLAEYYRTWGRCMDAARWCRENGETYWAEVALRAAQKLGGRAGDPRQLETLACLVSLYEQNGQPWLAKQEIQRLLTECAFGLGFHSPPTKAVRKLFKDFLVRHGQKALADKLAD